MEEILQKKCVFTVYYSAVFHHSTLQMTINKPALIGFITILVQNLLLGTLIDPPNELY